jgi:hypothetical protein
MNAYQPPRRSSSQRKRQESILFVLLGAFLAVICVSAIGLVLYLGGVNPFVFPFQLTATALAQRNASCQALIDKAIQASGNFCGQTSSNNVCYGNTTIQAELVPDATQRFSERGDIVAVNELRRLSAAPLNPANNEWGIAVFKVIANLPRSLPGETITMVVFGNTTLDNASGNLESFYFYSELGQIACQAVPFDGLMLSAPNGSGIRINVNGTELTLMGTASLKAVKNQEMEVSLFSGSGRVVSNGQEQYFGAGQKVHVGLGGPNGLQSTTGPSAPEPLTQDELNTACSVTGQYCAPSEIISVSSEEAQQQLQSQITSTPTSIFTETPTRTPSPTIPPSSTGFVLPSWTPRWTATPTRTLTPVNTATRTRAPTSTVTRTFTPSSTPTITATPTSTPVAPNEPICSALGIPVTLSALTNSPSNELGMVITNNSGGTITIDRFFAYWVKLPTSQKLDKLLLDGVEIWNRSDPDSPSDVPTEGGFVGGADRTILDTTARNLVIRFMNNLQSGNYEVHIVFNSIGCQVSGSVNIP